MAVLAAGSGNNLVTSATKATPNTTVAGWFKLTSLGAGSQSIFATGSTTNVIAANVASTGALSMLVDTTPTAGYTAPLVAGKWYWIGFRINAIGDCETFIGSLKRDGTAVVYFGATVTAANVTTILRIFTDHAGGFVLGAAENVMVWASARTDQQIADAAVLGYDPVAAGTSPWAWWPLATNADITDHSGNGRNLSLTGSVSTVSGPSATPAWGGGTSIAVKCVGNSITSGYDHDLVPPTYPSTLAALHPTFLVANLGHGGFTTNDLLSVSVNDLLYSVGYDNVVLFSETTNDANVDVVDATACLARIAAYVRFAHALGFDVITSTVLPYNNSSFAAYTQNAVTDSVNTSLRGGAIQGADLLADNAIDTYWVPSDIAVYRDGLHPSDAGYAHLGNQWDSALVAYLASFHPTINIQPVDQTSTISGSATFSVSATAGSGSLTYQWWRRATPTSTPQSIGGATSSSYTRSSLVVADNGYYFYCIVGDDNGSIATTTVRLILLFSVDVLLFAGQASPTDVKLRVPGTPDAGGSVALSGVSGTGAAGAVAPGISISAAGNAGTTAIGSVAVGVAMVLAGVLATGSSGSLGSSRSVAVTGAAATGSPGTVGAAADASAALTGVGGTGSLGSVTPSATCVAAGNAASGVTGTAVPSRSLAIAGNSGPGAVGVLGLSSSVSPVGNAATSVAGSAAPSTAIVVGGTSATGSPGTVNAGGDASAALTGAGATGAAGTIAPSVAVVPPGNSASGSAGAVSSAQSLAITGLGGSGSPGATSPSTTIAAVGNAGNGATGNVSAGAPGSAALTGVPATGAVGSFAAASSMSATGTASTGAAGTLVPSSTIPIAGVGASGSVGSVIVPGGASLSGVAATGALGSPSPSVTKGFTGNTATTAVGTSSPDRSVSASGVSASGAPGSVAFGGLTVALAGAAATAAAGATATGRTVATPGLSSAGSVGVVVSGGTPLFGVNASGASGSVAPSLSRALAGVGATGSPGTISGGSNIARVVTAQLRNSRTRANRSGSGKTRVR